jgi:DnaJ-class molecular chaperone
MSGDDLYALLGVGREASQDEIKQRYRKLAKELHPDLNPDKPDVADRFKRISAAYSLLSDPDKRARYDRGEIDASGQERPEQHFYREYADDPSAERFYAREGFGDAASMHEFFADLFGADRADGQAGDGRAGPRGGVRMRARGADVAYTLPVDFMDAAKGAKRRVEVGADRAIDLTIPAGVRDRQTLRLQGQGGPGFDGGPPGDAYVEIHVRPHAFFRQKDQNIHLQLPVSLAEAVLGGKITVPTIDGPVTMTVPKGANSGTKLRLRGKGIIDPASGRRGDQYVELELRLPETIDAELETLVRDWSAAHPYDPRAKVTGK